MKKCSNGANVTRIIVLSYLLNFDDVIYFFIIFIISSVNSFSTHISNSQMHKLYIHYPVSNVIIILARCFIDNVLSIWLQPKNFHWEKTHVQSNQAEIQQPFLISYINTCSKMHKISFATHPAFFIHPSLHIYLDLSFPIVKWMKLENKVANVSLQWHKVLYSLPSRVFTTRTSA